MPQLRTFNQIVKEEQPDVLCIIIPDPSWEHYHPERFPIPLQHWFDTYLPNTLIERIAGFDPHYSMRYPDDPNFPPSTIELTHPMFRVGMTEAQGDFLERYWSENMPQPKNGTNDFMLCTFVHPARPLQFFELDAEVDTAFATEIRSSEMQADPTQGCSAT
ncbi:MAG: hypothetical protein H6R18_299 [Proteobacteria bacterium]|nr:hypothetical protein [Pseudomonadota bacterium]